MAREQGNELFEQELELAEPPIRVRVNKMGAVVGDWRGYMLVEHRISKGSESSKPKMEGEDNGVVPQLPWWD